MEISVLVSYWANYYFFVQNLSVWHRSARIEYNNVWIDETGKLSDAENNALKRFVDVRSKFKQGKSIFEIAFFLHKDPFIFLKDNLGKEEFLFVKDLFEIFSNRFNYIYSANEKQLVCWKDLLKQEFSDFSKVDEICFQLDNFFGNRFADNEVSIFLLLSAGDRYGGGSNIDYDSISVELSGLSKEKKNLVMGVIWHELIHLKWQNVVLHDLLVDVFAGDMAEVTRINEMIVSALFPRGILGNKYYGIALSKKFNIPADVQRSDATIKVMREFIDSGRQVDRDFVLSIKSNI